MALGDVCHPAIPSGILAESQQAGHSVLLSKACHPPCRALRESDGPTTNPCDSQVGLVQGFRICTGMGETSGTCGAGICVDEL